MHVNELSNKFFESDESVIASARSCLTPMFPDKPCVAMPVFSSGQGVRQAPATPAALGSTDLIVTAGGGIVAHPGGPGAGVRALRQAWEAAAIGAALPPGYARAAEFSFEWGTDVPESHPLNVHSRKAAEALAQATDGRVELRMFPNNQLGGDADMLSQLRIGALECFSLSGVNVLSTILPSAAISGVGFAFKDYPT